MEPVANLEAVIAASFGPTFEQLRSMVGVVASGEANSWEHDRMEAWVGEQGRELQRLFLQGMFDERHRNEPKHSVVVGADFIERTHKRDRSVDLVTPVGEVEVSRTCYSAPEEGSVVPLDAQLALPPGRYSDGMKRLAAIESVRGSFEQAQRAIKRQTGVDIPKRQLLSLVSEAATDFEAFYDRHRVVPVEAGADDFLVLTCDGKGVVMRPSGLRDATRRAAEAHEHKLRGRLSKGEKNGRKRMAAVAAIYNIAPFRRTAEEIMDSTAEPEATRPRPINKRVFARLDVDMKQVVKDLFDEAEARDPERKRRWVVLVDGANHQLSLVRREARRRKLAVTIVVDFIHVLEYLWSAAWDFFEEGDTEAEAWVVQRAQEILRGKASLVAAGIRRSATLRKLERRGNADAAADYLLKKRNFLSYDLALEAGYPIATGVIEGACRHLVKDRMDITGARWGLEGGEAVLRLRSIWSSDDFEEYWPFHLALAHDRTYGSDYVRAAA
jgi:hypothetical protein